MTGDQEHRDLHRVALRDAVAAHAEYRSPNNGQHQRRDDFGLRISSVRDVAARVDALPPPRHLLRPIWPADAYGVTAAVDKAGKTWAEDDKIVSVASGTSWMGLYPCDTPGPVLAFMGEGGERKMIRRLRAVAAWKGVELEELPIRLCFRVPHLSNRAHLQIVRNELADHATRYMSLDPLYLAARGARGSDLYEMGAHLEEVQHLAQDAGAAFGIVTHFNKTGEGRGAQRITGVGPGAWGRVLATADVKHRRTEANGTTVVTLDWQFRGDEIPDTDITVVRRVWADDPDDLASPLHYEVELSDDPTGDDWMPTHLMEKVSRALEDSPDGLSKTQLRARVGGKAAFVDIAIEQLIRFGLVATTAGPRNATLHTILQAYREGQLLDPVRTLSQPVPGLGEVTLSRVPPSTGGQGRSHDPEAF